MDQFTYAERCTDWRANNNIAESIFEQMRREPHPVPAWVVTSAGTGGTTATIGRFVRYQHHATRLLCADPENSVFFDYYRTGDRSLHLEQGSRIEGIGRPRVEASFLPDVIDEMVRVPDALAFGAIHYLFGLLGRRVGGSTGTNFVGALHVAQGMKARGETGSIVTLRLRRRRVARRRREHRGNGSPAPPSGLLLQRRARRVQEMSPRARSSARSRSTQASAAAPWVSRSRSGFPSPSS
jgi:cysteine synthase